MSDPQFPFFDWAVNIALFNISLAWLGSLWRVLRGPALPDRMVGVDLMGVLATGFVAAYSIRRNAPDYLDLAITITLLGFLGTVAFARYLDGVAREGRIQRGEICD